MTTVARVIRATPFRSAGEAWEIIVGLLAPDGGAAHDELQEISGVATALIAAKAPAEDKIVVWGGGPRVRISCVYDENAITGDNSNETKLARSPTDGDWSMSLPCAADDLSWVQPSLAKKSSRISARKAGEKPNTDTDDDAGTAAAAIDTEAFFRP